MNRFGITKVMAIVIASVLVVAAVIGAGSYWYLTSKPPGTSVPDEVVVAAAFPLSGTMAETGTWAFQGVQLAIEQINAQGGIEIGGKNVTAHLAWADTTSDSTIAVVEVQRLISLNNPSVIIGAYASAITYAIEPLCERSKIPLFTGSSADDITLKGFNYVFRLNTRNTIQTIQVFDGIESLFGIYDVPLHKVVGLWDSGVYGDSYASQASVMTARYNMTYKAIRFDVGITDFSPIVMQIKDFAPDIVISNCYTTESAIFVRAMNDLDAGNIRLFLTDTSGSGQPAIDAIGAKEGVFSHATVWSGIFGNTSGIQKIKQQFYDRWNEEIPEVGLQYWNIAWLASRIIHAAQSVNATAIAETGHQVRIPVSDEPGTLGGLFTETDLYFDALGDCLTLTTGVAQLQSGRFLVVWPDAFKQTNAEF